MTHIVAFAASNQSRSINKQFAHWAVQQSVQRIPESSCETLDLNDYTTAIYSEDIEANSGIPAPIQAFQEKMHQADGLIISFAEHNGTFTAAFKNIFDWCSRIDRLIWGNTPTLALSTSPGARGGKRVLQIVHDHLPYFGTDIRGSMSLPCFHDHFSATDGIHDPQQRAIFDEALNGFISALI